MYDWFESFAVAMKGESREIPSAPLRSGDHGKGVRESTKHDVERGRASQKRRRDSMEAENGEEVEAGADDTSYGAEWRREIQARFLRSMHEVEWMGFLKSTGRKKEHVLRTVYDPPSK